MKSEQVLLHQRVVAEVNPESLVAAAVHIRIEAGVTSNREQVDSLDIQPYVFQTCTLNQISWQRVTKLKVSQTEEGTIFDVVAG